MEKSELNNPFLYVVGSGACGLLFTNDLKDKCSFLSIQKSKILPSPHSKIHITSCTGYLRTENNEIYHWGEIDYDESKKVLVSLPIVLYLKF